MRLKQERDSAIGLARLPFAVKHNCYRKPNAELREAMEDIRLNRNLHGPFATAEEAVRSMLAD